MDQSILNQSLLTFRIENPRRRAPLHSHQSIVTGDGQLVTFLAEEPSSPPVYANFLNPRDPNAYPIRVFDFDRSPMPWRPESQDRIQAASLYDWNNGLMWELSREQCTDPLTGAVSMTQSYTRGPDGRIGQFIVPSHLLDKVMRMDGVKHGAARIGDMREPAYGSFTLDSCVPGTYDYEMLRGPLREGRPVAPIYAGVRHAVADAIVALRGDMEALRRATRADLMSMQAAAMDASSKFRVSEMPEGVEVANLKLPDRVDPNNDWVVEGRLARA